MRRSIVLCALLAVVCAPAAYAGDVYAINLRPTPNTLLRFPANAPANNVISTTVGYDLYAMDFNSAATTLYGVDINGFMFGSIDTTTGAFSPIGATGLIDNTTGLSVDPTTETFYLTTYGTSNALYTVNPATGVATFVTGINTTGIMIDIAIDRNGQMYGHNISDDSLYLIDKTTGATTLLGATGMAANFAQGMDFDYETDTLYGTVYTGGGTGAFVSFDLTTGAANTIVSTTAWNLEGEMAVASAIPEPATVCLLALGALALIRRR